jgi:hypothetical protein
MRAHLHAGLAAASLLASCNLAYDLADAEPVAIAQLQSVPAVAVAAGPHLVFGADKSASSEFETVKPDAGRIASFGHGSAGQLSAAVGHRSGDAFFVSGESILRTSGAGSEVFVESPGAGVQPLVRVRGETLYWVSHLGTQPQLLSKRIDNGSQCGTAGNAACSGHPLPISAMVLWDVGEDGRLFYSQMNRQGLWVADLTNSEEPRRELVAGEVQDAFVERDTAWAVRADGSVVGVPLSGEGAAKEWGKLGSTQHAFVRALVQDHVLLAYRDDERRKTCVSAHAIGAAPGDWKLLACRGDLRPIGDIDGVFYFWGTDGDSAYAFEVKF